MSISVLSVLAHSVEADDVLDFARFVRDLLDVFPLFGLFNILLASLFLVLFNIGLIFFPLEFGFQLFGSCSFFADMVNNSLVESTLKEAGFVLKLDG